MQNEYGDSPPPKTRDAPPPPLVSVLRTCRWARGWLQHCVLSFLSIVINCVGGDFVRDENLHHGFVIHVPDRHRRGESSSGDGLSAPHTCTHRTELNLAMVLDYSALSPAGVPKFTYEMCIPHICYPLESRAPWIYSEIQLGWGSYWSDRILLPPPRGGGGKIIRDRPPP